MIELNSKIKEALIEIDFIKRYEEVSNKFNAERTPSKSRLVYIDGEEVMEIIQDLGYSPLFDSKEKFYKIREEQVERFTLGVHIILQGGMVDLVWVVRENIFEGNVRRGKAGGYHYECIKDTAGNIVNGTEVLINDLGVYKAQVEVNGIPKSGNGGYSTFFPKEKSPQDVIDSINEAYNNKVFVVGSKNSYIGISNNGLEIEMYINNNGKIISAFPKE